jgi:hypothetical protein
MNRNNMFFSIAACVLSLLLVACGEQTQSTQTCVGLQNNCTVINNNGNASGNNTASQTPTATPTQQVIPATVSTQQPTATKIPPTPTPASATYHLNGVIKSCSFGMDRGNYTAGLVLDLTVNNGTTLSGHMELSSYGEGSGNIQGTIDGNNHMDFYSGIFHWFGTLSAQHTVVDGTVYPIPGTSRCGEREGNPQTGTWYAK